MLTHDGEFSSQFKQSIKSKLCIYDKNRPNIIMNVIQILFLLVLFQIFACSLYKLLLFYKKITQGALGYNKES